jgi:hypothetical protein
MIKISNDKFYFSDLTKMFNEENAEETSNYRR